MTDKPKTDTDKAMELADIIIAKAWKKIWWYAVFPTFLGLNILYFLQ